MLNQCNDASYCSIYYLSRVKNFNYMFYRFKAVSIKAQHIIGQDNKQLLTLSALANVQYHQTSLHTLL